MNKKKYIIPILILSLISTNKVYASCTQEEIDEFKKIEDEYTVTYEPNKENQTYTITVTTPEYHKYRYYIDGRLDLSSKDTTISTTEITIKNVATGTYYFSVDSINGCNTKLKEIELYVPKYNKYANDALCEGFEEFYLCQPTYEKEIDYETFKSRINTYKNTKDKETEEKNEESQEKTEIDKILSYAKNNKMQTTIIIIFVILLIITAIVTVNNARKSRRFE